MSVFTFDRNESGPHSNTDRMKNRSKLTSIDSIIVPVDGVALHNEIVVHLLNDAFSAEDLGDMPVVNDCESILDVGQKVRGIRIGCDTGVGEGL